MSYKTLRLTNNDDIIGEVETRDDEIVVIHNPLLITYDGDGSLVLYDWIPHSDDTEYYLHFTQVVNISNPASWILEIINEEYKDESTESDSYH